MLRTRVIVGVVVVGMLTGCAPGSPGSGGSEEPGYVADPWLVDDLDTGAGVVTGEFMGVALRGFTCDVSMYADAESVDGAIPRASVGGWTGASGIDYQDAQGISTAVGPGLTLTPDATTVTVTTTSGGWYIGDGGLNDPWTPSAQLTITHVPVPVDGCDAADLWASEMMEVETDPAEMIRAFTEDGLIDVSGDAACVEEGISWTPPNVPCDEFWQRVEAVS